MCSLIQVSGHHSCIKSKIVILLLKGYYLVLSTPCIALDSLISDEMIWRVTHAIEQIDPLSIIFSRNKFSVRYWLINPPRSSLSYVCARALRVSEVVHLLYNLFLSPDMIFFSSTINCCSIVYIA